ncbi:DUF2523 family protein [Acinetobacter baumannii]|uniref:DUF2523 family protein n=1 Tax=Acinetobacter baumannii TaxID=470 RepID=UPI0021BFC656|nr:DUF2523 family protein [Acinetobacter baumannii]MCT9386631.1 DUF2523 domain-containing protein [Acinetobacter baumannii]MDV5174178.1 DUF2523 family protein [Acinetobacter baumannii]MDV5176006.1 DUF2523 family protein [Acinetobacter baumannii]
MPSIIIRIALWMMTSFAGQVLYSLGLGMASFTAISSITGWIVDHLKVYFTGTTQWMLIWIDIFDIDYGVSVLISAFIIRTTIMSAQVAFTKK